MRSIFILLLTGIIVSLSSCRKDFEFETSNGGLQFSRDTVYLDTVFTNIGSSTYTLKVYNRSDKDIKIPVIKLGKGTDSKYRMTVDGMTGNSGAQGKIFSNVELLGKDSLYIFIETTAGIADANPEDFLYTDQIQFGAGTNLQTVELVTLIQDAIFLYPQRFEDGTTETLQLGEDEVYGFFLDENDPVHGNEYLFTNEKPYVIYGYAAVDVGKTLNIQPGARIHFHDASGIIVAEGGSIQAIGDFSTDQETLENEIIFEGDRLEPGFSDVPGQWGAIWLTSGSAASTFNHVTIKNGVIGLYVQNNAGMLTLKNTQIYDCSNYGVLAQTATIEGENVVINAAGQATLACTLGGSYKFTHCTFNNNWASSQQVAVRVDNYFNTPENDNEEVPFPLTKAEFYNCIIFGSNQVELLIKRSDAALWTTPIFSRCMIKFNNTNNQFTNLADYQFLNNTTEIRKNGNPDFFNINNNQLMIGDDSDAQDFGILTDVTTDILNTPRVPGPTGKYDLGAYQHGTFPEED